MSSDKFSDANDDTEVEGEKTKTLQRKPANGDGVAAVAPARRASSGQDVLEALRSDPLYPKVESVVYWRDPITSALVLAIVSLGWFLVSVAEYSLLTLITYLYLGIFLVSFVLVQYANFSGNNHLLRSRIGQIDDIVSRNDFSRHGETLHRLLDAVALLGRDALFFEDVVFSLKTFGVGLSLAILGNYVSVPTLIFSTVIILFAIPRVYEEKKDQIDGLLNQAVAAANQKVGPIIAKVPLDKLQLKVKTE